MEGSLRGQSAIVTGAGSGIGAAAAEALAARGASVGCVDIDGPSAAATAARIVEAGGSAMSHACDIATVEGNQGAVDAVVRRFGGLQLACLNAGILRWGSVLDMAIEDFDDLLRVNVRGTFLGVRAFAPALIEAGGGAMVITSSGLGSRGTAYGAAYSATKHALLGLMRSAAADLAPYGIRVNAVCPGVIDTPIQGSHHGDPDALWRTYGPGLPIGRVGRPEEIAEVVAFLLGAESSFMTGASVAVDGGATAILGPVPRRPPAP
jgi:NAD(P)-dependent dehydrogenase (short-subunit alcohol dehydrogenase family)